MGINVKNERVEAAIRVLADKMGVGLTEAIDAGIQAKLAELEAARQAEIARKLAAIAEMQARIAPLIPPGTTSSCDEFYDEDGLPA